MGILKSISGLVVPSVTYLGNTLILAVIILAAFGFSFRSLIALAGLVIIEIVCIGIKFVYFRERPNKQKYTNIIERLDASGFPSVHAARSAFIFLYIASYSGIAVKVMLIGLILLVGISRLILKKHYLIDIVVGYALGVLVFLAAAIIK
jgi:membrane-associated phospholipid phosphatase